MTELDPKQTFDTFVVGPAPAEPAEPAPSEPATPAPSNPQKAAPVGAAAQSDKATPAAPEPDQAPDGDWLPSREKVIWVWPVFEERLLEELE